MMPAHQTTLMKQLLVLLALLGTVVATAALAGPSSGSGKSYVLTSVRHTATD